MTTHVLHYIENENSYVKNTYES